MPEDDDLNEELDRGTELIRQLVEHMVDMGGASEMCSVVEYVL